MGIKDIMKGRYDVYRLNPRDLKVKEGWNSRDLSDPANADHVDRIAQSMASEGVKNIPLTAYREGEDFFVEDGHCRREGALLAIEKYGAPADLTLPVQLSEKDATDEDRILSQIVRNSGKPLTALEMATVYKKLSEAGMSNGDIAKRAGVSRVYVGQLLELIAMPEKVLEPIRKGSVSPTLAIQIMKDNEGDAKATAKAIKDAISVATKAGKDKATAKHVKAAKEGGTEPKPKRAKPVDVAREILDRADFSTGTDENDEALVILAMTPGDWETLFATLGLTPKGDDKEQKPRDREDFI